MKKSFLCYLGLHRYKTELLGGNRVSFTCTKCGESHVRRVDNVMLAFLAPPKVRNYIHRPIAVRAIKVCEDRQKFMSEAKVLKGFNSIGWGDEGLMIKTAHGVVYADVGDFIVESTEGDLYPVKASTFAKLYKEPTK